MRICQPWSKVAVATILAVSSATSAMLPTVAMAADTDRGSIVISAVDPDNAVGYKAYKIFSADLDETGKARYITWANSDVETAVKSAVSRYAAANSIDIDLSGMSERDVLDFIDVHWVTSSYDTIASAGTLPEMMSAAIASSSAASVALEQGVESQLEEGWWLALTDTSTMGAPSSSGVGKASTAPIFFKSNKDVPVNITEKTSVPRVVKEVKDDDAQTADAVAEHYEILEPGLGEIDPTEYYVFDETTYSYVPYSADLVHGQTGHYHIYEDDSYGQWKGEMALYRYVAGSPADDGYGNVADANRGQALNFRVTGTLPANISTYGTFAYEFEDTMSGLDVSGGTDGVTITIDGVEVAEGFSVTKDGSTLRASASDLLSCKDSNGDVIPVDANSVVQMTYMGFLTGDASTGSAGNANDVKLRYTKSPNDSSMGETSTTQVKTYSYAFELTKKALDGGAALAGMKYTVQDDATGLYVQQDGSLSDSPYEFETDGNGKSSIMRLDTGTYTLHETQAPVVSSSSGDQHYAMWTDDVKLTISADYDAGGSFVPGSLQATLSGGDDANQNRVTAYDETSGKVSVDVTDDLKLGMPITGQAGTMLVSVLGLAIVAVSLNAMRKRRSDVE